MVLELAQPAAFLLCILSLASTFHAAFLVPAAGVDERIRNGLLHLALAAAIALVSGLLFREAAGSTPTGEQETGAEPRLAATLPIRLFCWAAAVMLLLFAVSWYLETYFIFYRDIRF